MWADFRYALRQWKRSKALIVTVVLLLGIGIGANTLIFSLINAAILKPLPVRDPQNLFLIEKNRAEQLRPDTGLFYPVYEQIRARKDLFSAVVASQEWGKSSFQPLDLGDEAKLVSTAIVSPNYFSELGVEPILGRALTPSDATVTSGIPVVISEQFWKSDMNGSRKVLGRALRIKKFPFQIVGVLPKAFHGLNIDRVPDIWLPISAARILTGESVFHPNPTYTGFQFQVLVRLTSKLAPDAAAAAITRTMRDVDSTMAHSFLSRYGSLIPEPTQQAILRHATDYQVELQSIGRGVSRMRQQFSTALYALMGAAGLLLLAMCASVSGMLLAKAEQRKREIAVRVAVGARRTQLLRQTFIESLLWTIPSTGLALLFFYLASPVLIGLLPKVRGFLPTYAAPQVIEVTLDWRVILFIIVVCLLTTFLSGLGAAWRSTRVDVVEDLKQQRERKKGAFSGMVTVGAQVTVSVVLVAGAVMMLKTFWTLQHVNPGFDPAHIIEFDLNPEIAGYSVARARTLLRDLRQEIALLPGVRSVAGAEMGLIQGVGVVDAVVPEGNALPPKTYINTSANTVLNPEDETGEWGTQ